MRPNLRSAVCAAMILMVAAPAGARHRSVDGSFDASAMPLMSPSIYGVDGECFDRGVEGIHRVSKRFVAPFDGFLMAEIHTDAGGWTLLVDDPSDTRPFNRLASSSERVDFVPLDKGQEVDIIACNAMGAPTAEVTYSYFHANFPSPYAKRGSYVHPETAAYATPTAGTVAPIRYEGICLSGCVEFDVSPSDRYITAEVDDMSGGAVSAMIYQNSDVTGRYQEDFFCTSTDDPIEVIPFASVIGVGIALGPCEDGTPATATSGSVTVTFSDRP